MAKKSSLNFIELHVEKIVLGLAVAFAVVIVAYFIMGPNTVEYNRQELGSDELDEAIARSAEALERARVIAPIELEPVPESARLLQDDYKSGLALGGDLPQRLIVATSFGRPTPEFEVEEPPKDIVLVTPLQPAAPPVMRTGMSLIYRQALTLGATSPGGTPPAEEEPVECAWVSGAVWYPKVAQIRDMLASGYEGYRSKVYVVGVDVQRQQMTASGEFSDWREVEPGTAMPRLEIPTPEFDERTSEVRNQADLDRTLEVIKASQVVLMEPEFYEVAGGDDWRMPALPGLADEEEEGEVKWEDPRPKTESSGQSPDQNQGMSKREIRQKMGEIKDLLKQEDWSGAERAAQALINNAQASNTQKRQAKGFLAQARKSREKEQRRNQPSGGRGTSKPGGLVTDPNSDEKDPDPAIWFHDDSVEPGKTYRYRMRVKLWNRYVGKRAVLRDPAQAEQTVLVGQWSPPGDPITVAPKTRFFLKAPRFGEGAAAASVDVFTWHAGEWYKGSFTVQVGDVIGKVKEIRTSELDDSGRSVRADLDFTTGALVLDLRIDEPVLSRSSTSKGDFNYSEVDSVVLVCLDPADGQVKERIGRLDRADPDYKRLKDEAAN
ncbi:MAG: hypothetical protein KAY37_04220 [Phycisphaerae bacterium]|nr:hypothetical protein [Phycisphaerae bacterium]